MKGNTTDAKTGQPLYMANVFFSDEAGEITGELSGTATDPDGNYYLPDREKGFITASYTGYVSKTKPIPANSTTPVNFALIPGVNLKAVEIRAEKPGSWFKRSWPILLTLAVITGLIVFSIKKSLKK